MIDFHSHVLPEIDDGSQSPEESVRMLQLLRQQGVDTVIATPHFYCNQDNPNNFLARREESFQKLPYDPATMPKLLLGAEVTYFRDMSRSEELRRLCIGESPVLLIEMPFYRWTKRMVEDLCNMHRMGYIPVLAHVDRYRKRGQFLSYWRRLQKEHVLFQCNADAFLPKHPGNWLIRMLKKGHIHFIGSDCHNMENRISNIDLAADRITQKLGQEIVDTMDSRAQEILAQKRQPI